MIVPMKKVSLIIPGDQKAKTLKTLRKLGIVHMDIAEGAGEKLAQLKEQIILLENAVYAVDQKKKPEQKPLGTAEALTLAQQIAELGEEQKNCHAEKNTLLGELARLKSWGAVDPESIAQLQEKGIALSLYEMPKAEYEKLGAELTTVLLEKGKTTVKFALMGQPPEQLRDFRLELPNMSTQAMQDRIEQIESRQATIETQLASYAAYVSALQQAVKSLVKDVEFETYATGMGEQELVSRRFAYFTGYIAQEDLDGLKAAAAENAWGLLVEDPTPEDNVPTKLHNNKFVSLIYPLTDFLGTVPGYFEHDISAWFLMFILIFFGIIFGDGGYGLLVCAVAAVPILSALRSKKEIPAVMLLIGLFGLSTVLWGTLTCTWFGLAPEQLPGWLKALSVPVISNVYADKIWYPFWTGGEFGLTTAQNLQIFCFTLALIQLSVAHIKVATGNTKSLKILGDIGAILQLLGVYYLVLSLVVNPQVFSFSLVIAGIPVGTVAIALIGIGFALSFVFSNYEGDIGKSVVASLVNIVSVLLGVVNVFSDIVSYIRLWAVGLAGAAISATVNELAGPMFGNFLFMIFAIIVLVFGHGLNMILNVLSVVVHGIRLNTLEFSSHLDMAWSGYKFKPFEEQNDK